MNKFIWQKIIDSYSASPRDVATTPINGTPKWFYVYAHNDHIFIESGHNHINSSNITVPRMLDKNNLDEIYEFYGQRKQGKLRHAEALRVTQNSSYWFGIFKDLQL